MADIRFENITFRYGEHVILNNFSLTVEEGQIMGIVGPSGCGKTTLIRLLSGFIKPEQGEIYIGDTCVFSTKKRINMSPERRRVGVVFQDYAVWPHLTVLENIMYPLKKKKVPKKEAYQRAKNALAQVRMSSYEKHLPAQLSGGQQQRVAIARAIVSSDDVIILDEPITNLDAKLREEMLVEIQMIQKEIGTTIIYITHDQEAALQVCDKIAIMDYEGKICQIGIDEEIIKQPVNKFVYSFIGVSNFIPMVEKNDGVYFLCHDGLKYDKKAPEGFVSGVKNVMGIRPMNIKFNDDSPFKGTIVNATFLGNHYNYFVQFGDQKLRVQRSTLEVKQSRVYLDGEVVGVEFIAPSYYDASERGADDHE